MALIGLLSPGLALGESVRIKARTNLWIEISEERGLLSGYLADDVGTRLRRRRLLIKSEGTLHHTITEDDGAFEVPFPLGLRAQSIRVEFGGDTYHESSFIVRQIDPSRLPVQLQLLAPTIVGLDQESVEVQIRAEHAGQPIEIPIEIVTPITEQVLAQV